MEQVKKLENSFIKIEYCKTMFSIQNLQNSKESFLNLKRSNRKFLIRMFNEKFEFDLETTYREIIDFFKKYGCDEDQLTSINQK